jgi:hypothetical protein
MKLFFQKTLVLVYCVISFSALLVSCGKNDSSGGAAYDSASVAVDRGLRPIKIGSGPVTVGNQCVVGVTPDGKPIYGPCPGSP